MIAKIKVKREGRVLRLERDIVKDINRDLYMCATMVIYRDECVMKYPDVVSGTKRAHSNLYFLNYKIKVKTGI